jgi:hypothetical protein
MRGPFVIALLMLLLVGVTALWWTTREPEAPFSDPSPASSEPPTPSSTARPSGSERAPATATSPPASVNTGAGTLIATRAATAPVPAVQLANEPTAWLQLVDYTTKMPVVGAAVRSLLRGDDIAFSDEQGLVPLPLVEREQLAVVRDGYLLRLAPTRLGSTAAEPQAITLVPDRWSLVRKIEFPGSNGAEVFLRVRPRTPVDAARASPVPTVDDVLRRAWNEHAMLSSRPGCADANVQLPAWSEDRVHRLRSGDALRFGLPGSYIAEAATASGLVARGDLQVDGDSASALRLPLVRGECLAGQVVDAATGQPLAGASLKLQGSDPLGLLATTNGDGGFRLEPLLPGPVTLHVHHDLCQPLAFGPTSVPGQPVRIALVPLARTSLRGRVRMRPELTPVAGAAVDWLVDGKPPVTATTGADGTFAVAATGTVAARLRVLAPGGVAYIELVDPTAPFADYDVWPATPATRLAKGLTALFEGTVHDAKGPAANVAVRWFPATEAPPAPGMPMRRVLEGLALELSPTATTGADGSFRLETNHFGPGELRRVDDPTVRLDATAVAGKTTDRLRLTP